MSDKLSREQKRDWIVKMLSWEYDAGTEEVFFVDQSEALCGAPWPSLDAMAEVERQWLATATSQYTNYERQGLLETHIQKVMREHGVVLPFAYRATAEQREEAFGRAAGLW